MRSRLLFVSLGALALALLTTGCATDFRRDPEFGREAGFAIVSKAADIATTHAGLEQGFVESNPFLGRDQRKAVLVQVAGTSLVLWYAGRLKAEGNRHWKLPLRVWAVVSGSAAMWNGSLLARHYAHSSARHGNVRNPLIPDPFDESQPGDHLADHRQ